MTSETSGQDHVDALCERGNELQNAGDLGGALEAFEAALALVPAPVRMTRTAISETRSSISAPARSTSSSATRPRRGTSS